jgi:hypothetical protein
MSHDHEKDVEKRQIQEKIQNLDDEYRNVLIPKLKIIQNAIQQLQQDEIDLQKRLIFMKISNNEPSLIDNTDRNNRFNQSNNYAADQLPLSIQHQQQQRPQQRSIPSQPLNKSLSTSRKQRPTPHDHNNDENDAIAAAARLAQALFQNDDDDDDDSTSSSNNSDSDVPFQDI